MLIHNNLATIYSASLIGISKPNTKGIFFVFFVLVTKNKKSRIKPRASGHDTIEHLQIPKV